MAADFGLDGKVQINTTEAVQSLQLLLKLFNQVSAQANRLANSLKDVKLGNNFVKLSRDANAELVRESKLRQQLNKEAKTASLAKAAENREAISTAKKLRVIDGTPTRRTSVNLNAPTSEQISAIRNKHSSYLQSVKGYSPAEASQMASLQNYRTMASITNKEATILAGTTRKRISDEQRVTKEKEKQLRIQQRQKEAQGRFLDGIFNIKNALMMVTAGAMAKFVQGLIETSNRLQAIDIKFQAITHSSSLAKDEMDWIWKRAKSLKAPILEASEGYAQFYAAAKSSMNRDQMRNIYDSLLKTSVVLHLNKDRFKLVSLAMEQMASKGTVSMEELRRQLGEHVPGAFGIAARSMGVTEKKFNDMVKNGQVFAKDFLPKFASQLEKEFGSGLSAAMQSSQNKITDMRNAILELQKILSESGFADAVGNVADAIRMVIQGDKFESTMRHIGHILLDISKQMKIIVPLATFLINTLIGTALIKAIGAAKAAITLAFSETALAATLSMGLWGLAIGMVSMLIYNNIDKVMNWLDRLQKWRNLFEIEGIGTINILAIHAGIAIDKLSEKLKVMLGAGAGGALLGLALGGIPGMIVGGLGTAALFSTANLGGASSNTANNSNVVNYGGVTFNTSNSASDIATALNNNSFNTLNLQ